MTATNDEYERVCRKALEAIAPCVVGWGDGVNAPVWVEKLAEVVPDLQRVLGLPIIHPLAPPSDSGETTPAREACVTSGEDRTPRESENDGG